MLNPDVYTHGLEKVKYQCPQGIDQQKSNSQGIWNTVGLCDRVLESTRRPDVLM